MPGFSEEGCAAVCLAQKSHEGSTPGAEAHGGSVSSLCVFSACVLGLLRASPTPALALPCMGVGYALVCVQQDGTLLLSVCVSGELGFH